ncbi:hypothetical protein ACLESD_22110 [Pyxidicoccus sp. 3LFB2]
MKTYLTGLVVSGVLVLGTGCMGGKRAGPPEAPREDPAAAHRTEWVKALATGDNCVPDTPSSFKGVCLAASAWPEARRPPQAAGARLWGMTFRERFEGTRMLQQGFHPAVLELTPTPDGGLSGTFVELWPEHEADIDYLGSTCERFDEHYFRSTGEPPALRMRERLAAKLERQDGTQQDQFQPTPWGYRAAATRMELRPFQQGWVLVTEVHSSDAPQEETRVLGVFLPYSWPEPR